MFAVADPMATPTGVSILDDMLAGGLPEERAVLLIGGPGTGKSTLGMQFLQDGIERGETCLFVSTEQTPDELVDSFAPYDFDLADDDLQIETIHATLGETLDDESGGIVLESLGGHGASDNGADQPFTRGGGNRSFGEFGTPFERENVSDVLAEHAPCDRVVFDSVSGLEAMAEHPQMFRRAVLDFIRLFTDRFGATTLFTAEETGRKLGSGVGTSGMLQFNTHGVIRLWREQVDGDFHRFIQVRKMRGVNHETRAYEVEFDPRGVHVVPERWTPASSVTQQEPLRTGISGLDALCGGGLIQGGTALLEHDGLADVNPLVVNMLVEAVRRDDALVLLPPSNLEPDRLDRLISERIGSIESLLQDDQLFVLDLVGNWTQYDYNVFSITDRDRLLRNLFGGSELLMSWQMKRIFRTMNARRGDKQALIITYTDAMLQELTPKEIRRIHQWGKKKLFYPEDTVLFVQNPRVMQEQLSEFFVLDSQQVLRTWMHDRGLQYVKLEKSPMGHLGSSKLVKHVEYPPYVRIQQSHSASQPATGRRAQHPNRRP